MKEWGGEYAPKLGAPVSVLRRSADGEIYVQWQAASGAAVVGTFSCADDAEEHLRADDGGGAGSGGAPFDFGAIPTERVRRPGGADAAEFAAAGGDRVNDPYHDNGVSDMFTTAIPFGWSQV